ncbi:hypothetical protein H4R34_005619, partial [Dimargaris verticillata]
MKCRLTFIAVFCLAECALPFSAAATSPEQSVPLKSALRVRTFMDQLDEPALSLAADFRATNPGYEEAYRQNPFTKGILLQAMVMGVQASLQPYIVTGQEPEDKPNTNPYETAWKTAKYYKIHMLNDVNRQPKPLSAFHFISQLANDEPIIGYPHSVTKTINDWTDHMMQVTSDLITMSAGFIAFVAKLDVSSRTTTSGLDSDWAKALVKATSAYDFMVCGILGDFAERDEKDLESLDLHFQYYDEMKVHNRAISLEMLKVQIQSGLDLNAPAGGQGEALKQRLQELSQSRPRQQTLSAVGTNYPPSPPPPQVNNYFQASETPKPYFLHPYFQLATSPSDKEPGWLRRQFQKIKEKFNSLR